MLQGVRGRPRYGPVGHGLSHTVLGPPLSASALTQASASERSRRTHTPSAPSLIIRPVYYSGEEPGGDRRGRIRKTVVEPAGCIARQANTE